MTSDLDSGGESPTERRRRRVFRIRIWIGVGCLVLADFALSRWGGLRGAGPWRFGWAVLPLLPVAWIVVSIVLRVRQLDEYQTKRLFPGVAIGFGVAIGTAMTVGTLNSAGLTTMNGGWVVCLAGLFAWAITALVTGAPKA